MKMETSKAPHSDVNRIARLTEELKQSVESLKGTKVSDDRLFELSLKRDFIKFLINKERGNNHGNKSKKQSDNGLFTILYRAVIICIGIDGTWYHTVDKGLLHRHSP